MHAFYIQSWIYDVNEITAQKKIGGWNIFFVLQKNWQNALFSVLRLEKKR